MDSIVSSDNASRQSKIQEDTYFRIMRLLEENPEMSQRDLAAKLGMSLGGLNYCACAFGRLWLFVLMCVCVCVCVWCEHDATRVHQLQDC